MSHGASKRPAKFINVGLMQHLTRDVPVPHPQLLPPCLGCAGVNFLHLSNAPRGTENG